MQNHYYNPDHPWREYLFSVPANPDFPPPPNALRLAPEMKDGFWPGESGGAWVYFESRKGQQGWLDGEPHAIAEHGPPPEGWSDAPPPPTEAELAAARRAEILAELEDLDRQSVRALRAMARGAATEADLDRLAALEARAGELRARGQAPGPMTDGR